MTAQEYQKEWRLAHKKELKIYQREWRKKNIKKVRAAQKKYRDDNPDKVKGWQRKHYDKIRKEKIKKEAVTEIVCSKCKKLKPIAECKQYKRRNWKICDTCYAEHVKPYTKKVYRDKLKKDPEWVKKNRARARAYHRDNKQKVLKKAKAYRSTKKYKRHRRAYIRKNKKKIHAQEVITKKRFHEKNRDKLTDKYITGLFRSQGFTNPTPFEIEKKRVEILISRITKKMKEVPTGEQKICTKCKIPQDLKEFYINKRTGKRIARCRTCNSKVCKKYRTKTKRKSKYEKEISLTS